MRKLNIFEKIVDWFRSLFINEKKAKENSDKLKKTNVREGSAKWCMS